jgi:tetratricopeptide (TPR) repeat protein
VLCCGHQRKRFLTVRNGHGNEETFDIAAAAQDPLVSNSADWNRVDAALDVLLALPPTSRSEALARVAADDAALCAELKSLLAYVDGEDALLDAPAIDATSSAELPGSLGAGHLIGSYRIVSLVGRGGMGEVYKAERVAGDFRQVVALKLMRTDAVGSIERFHAERQILAELDHPGIARLLDGGVTADGRPYMAMEYVEGLDLMRHCASKRASLEERLGLFYQVCDAVAYAHEHLVVHRDLKPNNISVNSEGRVKLLDFGIAKLILPNTVGDATYTRHLSPAYAAPEQLTGGAITTATDVHGLGATLYQLLCGKLPRDIADLSFAAAIERILDFRLIPPSQRLGKDWPVSQRQLQGDIDAIVAMALRAEPKARYAGARALAEDLVRHQRSEPVQARVGARAYVLRRLIRRNWRPLSATAAIFLVLLAGIAGIAWQAANARQQAARATATKDFLLSVFKASDPRVARDQPRGQITAKELIDANAGRIEKEFAQQPELQIELLGLVAEIYGYLSDADRFDALQKRRVEMARRYYGPSHPIVIQGMITDAWGSIYNQHFAAANSELAKIDELLNGSGNNRSLLRAQWWLAKEQALKATSGTLDDREQALTQAIALYSTLSARSDEYASALANAATLRSLREDYAAACRLDQQAIAIEQGAADRDDGDLLMMFRNLARCEQERGEFDAAGRDYDHAAELEIKTFGTHHGLYWMIQADHARMLHLRGERQAALLMFERLLGDITPDWQATTDDTRARMYYAASLAAEGRPQQAIPLLEAAESVFTARPRDESDLRRLRLLLGDAYDRAGRVAQARATLQSALDETVAKDSATSAVALAMRERWGRFLLAHSRPGDADFAAAESDFRDVLVAADGQPRIEAALAQADLALIALARGDARGASQFSAAALASLDRVKSLYDVRMRPYIWLVRSTALRAIGDLDGARQWARQALDADRQYDDPTSPDLAALRTALQ